MKVFKYNIDGEKIGDYDLPSDIFESSINLNCIYESIKSENLNLRLGNRKVKSRSEVSGGGKKPWSQKGTGNARQGSIRSPQWRGGGIVHGPVVRNFSSKLGKKTKKKAILSVLSLKAKENNIVVIDDITLDSFSSKKFVNLTNSILGGIKDKSKKSFIISGESLFVKKSLSNISSLNYVNSKRISCMSLYYSSKLFITEKSILDMVGLWGVKK